jgi:hypothetical protein
MKVRFEPPFSSIETLPEGVVSSGGRAGFVEVAAVASEPDEEHPQAANEHPAAKKRRRRNITN